MAAEDAKPSRSLRELKRPDIPDLLAAAERERQGVRDLFPLEGWPSMPLEQYALGTGASEAPYCAVLEYHTNNLGSIRGGSAAKHVIYQQRNGEWWRAAPLRKLSPQDAWARLRSSFVAAFEAVAKGDFDALDDLSLLRHGQTLVTKSLAVYFPGQFLPIFAAEHLRQFIRLFGDQPEAGAAAWRLNRQFQEMITHAAVLDGWTPIEVMRALYDQLPPAAPATTPWKIAPGERGRFWDDCRDNGFICVGWGEVGDLAQYPTKADLQQRLDELPQEVRGGQTARVATDLLRFRDLQPGARVLANRGLSEVLAVGTVNAGGYSYVSGEPYPHRVGVDWDTSFAQVLEGAQAGWRSTFAPVSQQLWASIQHRKKGAPPPAPVEPDTVRRVRALLERKGQVILFGPPGTGKTRLALDVALAAVGEIEALTAGREQRRQRIDAMLGAHRDRAGQSVWLFVANPKQWSWTNLERDGTVEYRRGRISRHFEQMRPGDLVVGYEGTPVKKTIALARIDAVELARESPVRLRWVRGLDGPTYDEWRSDPLLADSEPAVHRMQGTAFRLTNEQAGQVLGDEAPSATDDDVPTVSVLTFHPSYGYEDFVEAFRPVPTAISGLALKLSSGYFRRVCAAAEAHPDRDYLLIIDEINRADLPRVFGELITLLEPDKRGMKVVLPISGHEFQIPPNIRIIGTMNTADRSVAHLDAAVRRRFGFVEVPPNPDVLNSTVGALDLGRLLSAINERITRHVDSDHTLGHSFFLVDDLPAATEEVLHSVWYDDVVPLLEDYVIGDAESLASILGADLVDRGSGQITVHAPEDLVEILAKEFPAALAGDAGET